MDGDCLGTVQELRKTLDDMKLLVQRQQEELINKVMNDTIMPDFQRSVSVAVSVAVAVSVKKTVFVQAVYAVAAGACARQ